MNKGSLLTNKLHYLVNKYTVVGSCWIEFPSDLEEFINNWILIK